MKTTAEEDNCWLPPSLSARAAMTLLQCKNMNFTMLLLLRRRRRLLLEIGLFRERVAVERDNSHGEEEEEEDDDEEALWLEMAGAPALSRTRPGARHGCKRH